MNLANLFEMQKGLDAHIEKEHPRKEGEDRLSKKILALQVELGELANELPEVFKFWSNKKNNRVKALKEYVDGLHFILSIGLELGFDEYHSEIDIYQSENLITHFNTTFWTITELNNRDLINGFDYIYMFGHFIGLGEMLEFTWDEIECAYFAKNEINHQRQQNGY